MKSVQLLTSILIITLLQSCQSAKKSSSENTIFWVSGYKTECTAGAGKTECLNIYKGKNFTDANWENFYAPIEGFDFEAGYLQKIEVETKTLNKDQVPADASSIKYTLVKVLDKQRDIRTLLNGSWLLQELNGETLDEGSTTPTLDIDLTKKRVSGSNSCNNYTASIEAVTPIKLILGNIASTKKMCLDMTVASAFDQALNSLNTHQLKSNHLMFFNEDGKKILSFKRN